MFLNIVGAGAGPFIVGALSDIFAPRFGTESIRYALLCSLAIGAVGGVLLIFASRYLEQDLGRVSKT